MASRVVLTVAPAVILLVLAVWLCSIFLASANLAVFGTYGGTIRTLIFVVIVCACVALIAWALFSVFREYRM